MRTETRTYLVYPIVELTEQAQSNAHYKWLENFDYSWSSDNHTTLEQFEKLFSINVRNWQYDSCSYNYSFLTSLSGEVEELCGKRLAAYIYNNYSYKLFSAKIYWGKGYSKKRKSRIFTDNSCTLTGYCMDDTILQPIYNFLQKPNPNTTFLNLIDECLTEFFKGCRDDREYQESQENFIETSIANDWEYLQDGTLFN